MRNELRGPSGAGSTCVPSGFVGVFFSLLFYFLYFFFTLLSSRGSVIAMMTKTIGDHEVVGNRFLHVTLNVANT